MKGQGGSLPSNSHINMAMALRQTSQRQPNGFSLPGSSHVNPIGAITGLSAGMNSSSLNENDVVQQHQSNLSSNLSANGSGQHHGISLNDSSVSAMSLLARLAADANRSNHHHQDPRNR